MHRYDDKERKAQLTAFVIPGSDPEEWHRDCAVNEPEDGIHLND